MKRILFITLLVLCSVAAAGTRGMKSTEKHASNGACQKAIEAYAREREARAHQKPELVKVRRSGEQIEIELSASTERLYCKDNIAHHLVLQG